MPRSDRNLPIFGGQAALAPAAPPSLSVLTHFQLSPKPEKQVFQLDRYLPPGSYAPALVIAGVDAAVGINS